ncbi:MAG: hypothetical protein IT306_21910, partial [Chloroflexi bacterium]|nr:hypothetical protein [Chloroflexota bacterium]
AEVIEGQQVGRVENEDTASLENTVSKMAQKRAHIAATLNATGASRIFTQDLEDLPQFQQAFAQTTAVPSDVHNVGGDPTGDDIDERLDAAKAKRRPRGPEPTSSDQVRAAAMVGGAQPARHGKSRAELLALAGRGIAKLRSVGGEYPDVDLTSMTDAEIREGIKTVAGWIKDIEARQPAQAQADDVVDEDEEAF